jgi:transcriptional regulator with XRE-family HTH domain
MTPAERFAAWLGPAMRRADLDIDKPQGGGRVALATALNVSRSTVGRWLDGKAVPSPEYFEPIAEALGIPVVDLLIGAGIVSPESLDLMKNPPSPVPTAEEAAIALGINPDDQELFLSFVEQLQRRAKRAS